MAAKAQAQAPGALYIEHWLSGLVTNRAATATPYKYAFGTPIRYYDALIDGSNVEITPANTLARRPGWPKFNSTSTISNVLGFFSAVLNGAQYDFVDTTTNVYIFTSTTLTSIYTKTTTAQTRYCQVGNVVFFSDGASNKKVNIDSQGNLVVSNAGIATPTSAPTIPNLNLYDKTNFTQTTHCWVPGASYGPNAAVQNYILQAPTGEFFWAVLPAGTSATSQTSTPNWAAAYGNFGAVVTDGTMFWTNCGAANPWAANTAYLNKTYVLNNLLNTANTVSSVALTGSGTFANWSNTGSSWGIVNSSGHTGTSNILQVSGLGLAVPANATITGVTATLYKACNRVNSVSDVTVQLLKAGVAAGSNKAQGGFWPQTAWNSYNIPTSGGRQTVYGSNSDLWGTTLTPSDVNNSGFGVQIQVNQASSSTTSAALTDSGAAAPILITVYYKIAPADITGTTFEQIVIDSNGNLQGCKTGGTSGSSAPSWAKTVASTTTDGTVTWECLGTAAQLPAVFSWTYAYGFRAGGDVPHLSTMSATITAVAPIVGNAVNIQGFGSNDTQVDNVDLYRGTDGGALLLYDTSQPNVNASTAVNWPDIAYDTALNNQFVGPVAHLNDPPPAGATLLAFHMGRMWAAVGHFLYFSAGPDCTNGDGMQAWPPANVFPFPSDITALHPTSEGLVVLTSGWLSIIIGGPQTNTFWPQPLKKNFGVLNQNCVAQEEDTLYCYTTQSQLFALTPNGKDEIGWKVAPTLAANFNPSTAYLAIHRSGADQGLFITDAATKQMRYNLNSESWDPIGTVSGLGPIASLDTAIGTRKLVSVTGSYIVNRDPTVFADSGAAMSQPYATVGSIVLSKPGEPPASLEGLVLVSAAVGAALTLSVMPNEIGAPAIFTNLPTTRQDPPLLPASQSISMNWYDWRGVQSQLANHIKHIQVKITLPAADTVKNEILSLTLL